MDFTSALRYIETIIKSPKTQFTCALSFGLALYVFYEDVEVTSMLVLLTVAALLPACALLYGIGEWFKKCFDSWRNQKKKIEKWNSLTSEELGFVSYYWENNTKCRYVLWYVNGAYQDSGIINPLINKNILYMAGRATETRKVGEDMEEECIPFNINDEAFEFFKKKFDDKKP